MRIRITPMLAATAALALVAGCADSAANSDSTNASAAPEAGITGKVVQIGISSPESGAASSYAAISAGFKAYLQYVTDKGGVNGYTFATNVIDNQGTTDGAAAALRQTLQNKPFLVQITGSAPYQGSIPALKSDGGGIPVVSVSNAQIVADSKVTNSYGLAPNYNSEALFEAQYLISTLGAKKLAVAYEDDAVGQGAGKVVPDYAAAHGATATPVAVPASTTNFASYASKLKDSGATAVVAFAISPIVAGLQKAAAGIGYNPTWITFASVLDQSYLNLAGAAAEGTYVDAFTQPVTATTPEATLFRDQMAKYAAKSAGTIGSYGWSLAAVVVQAVTDATATGKALTRQSFVDALNKLNGKPLGLLFGADFTGADHSTLIKQLKLYKVQNGAFVSASDLLPIPSA